MIMRLLCIQLCVDFSCGRKKTKRSRDAEDENLADHRVIPINNFRKGNERLWFPLRRCGSRLEDTAPAARRRLALKPVALPTNPS